MRELFVDLLSYLLDLLSSQHCVNLIRKRPLQSSDLLLGLVQGGVHSLKLLFLLIEVQPNLLEEESRAFINRHNLRLLLLRLSVNSIVKRAELHVEKEELVIVRDVFKGCYVWPDRDVVFIDEIVS